MRKIFHFLLITLGICLLTGCVNLNIETTINKDKSMSIEIKALFDMEKIGNNNSMAITFEDIVNDELINSLKNNGYSLNEYHDDKYDGYIITKSISSIDDVTSNQEFEILNIDKLIDINNKYLFYKDGRKYVARFILTQDTFNSLLNQNDLVINSNDYNIEWNLNLPNESFSNNAQVVDNNNCHLKWNLDVSIYNTVKWTFIFENDNALIIKILKVLLIIIILLIIIFIINHQRKIKDSLTEDKKSLEDLKEKEKDDLLILKKPEYGLDEIIPIKK